MPPYIKKIGQGMTEREIEVCSPADPSFGEFFAKSRRGWNKAIRDTGSVFGAVSLEAHDTCKEVLSKLPEDFEAEGDDTPEEFCIKIEKHILCARYHISKGNADAAAVDAWRAGVLWSRADAKWRHEEDWKKAAKMAGGSESGAHETNKRHELPREARLQIMEELTKKHSDLQAAKLCAIRVGEPEKWQGVLRQYQRFKKS